MTVPLVDPSRVPGRWPIALQLGAVGDRVSASDLLALGEQVQAAAAVLPVEGLSLAEPGDLGSLNYEPRPGAGNHSAGCDCTAEHSHEPCEQRQP